MPVTLHGYRHSVYSWIARLTLHEKGVAHDWVEVDPFSDDVPAAFFRLQPFQRVPVLVDGDFALYETGAILRYIDEAFDGPALQSQDPRVRARASQLMSIVDSYGYWPLVRQVFSHGYFRAIEGEPSDPAEMAAGLRASERVLAALEALAAPGEAYLTGPTVSLADLHVFPMVDYAAMTKPGAGLLARFGRLSEWHARLSKRVSVRETRPDFS